ncbi:MAG: hypothetical protein NDI61_03145, partial [Bdellovibrionaceae bacterium]|nr:hypothetical protein [Pseudobdellovibrionaceae bacterium]
TYSHLPFANGPATLAATIVFIFSLVGLAGLISHTIHFFWPLQPRRFPLNGNESAVVLWRVLGFLNLFSMNLLLFGQVIPLPFRAPFLRWTGAKIGRNAMINGKIIEPYMIAVGDDVILGEDSLILGHLIARDEVILDRVFIGNGATIGAKAIIMPGVTVGEGAVVWAGALVPKGTVIFPGEDWAGVPARKVNRSMEPPIANKPLA